MSYARFRPVGDSLGLQTPYAPDLVAALKGQVPHTARRWDGTTRTWLINPAYASHVADLCEQYLGVRPAVPVITAQPVPLETRLGQVMYVGTCKERGDEYLASAFVDRSWSWAFPEAVLRRWFEGEDAGDRAPDQAATLYMVLGIKTAATPDEIKAGYRRMARQWHPDVCKEPDAQEQFLRIKQAYDVLTDENKRARYDAGRAIEATIRQQEQGLETTLERLRISNQRTRGQGARWGMNGEYRAPLRCGYVLAEGRESLGVFVVSAILGWEDVTRDDGATMVTSWPAGAKSFTTDWV